jgi:hypothetical protein
MIPPPISISIIAAPEPARASATIGTNLQVGTPGIGNRRRRNSGTSLFATIAAFSAALHRRRRGVPVKTSTRRNLSQIIITLSAVTEEMSLQPGWDHTAGAQ